MEQNTHLQCEHCTVTINLLHIFSSNFGIRLLNDVLSSTIENLINYIGPKIGSTTFKRKLLFVSYTCKILDSKDFIYKESEIACMANLTLPFNFHPAYSVFRSQRGMFFLKTLFLNRRCTHVH